jgi:hypothetical protein
MLPTVPPVKPFHLHLVGRGDVKTLGIPAAVSNMTTVHFNLKFPQYYDQVSNMCRPEDVQLCCRTASYPARLEGAVAAGSCAVAALH